MTKALRFAVGNSDEYRSAVWRLWIQGKDVYLAARTSADLIKFSMHRSGIWRLAWTKQSGITALGSSDRVEGRWTRPPQFRVGWTQGPSVVVPSVELARPFKHASTGLGEVVWIPPAGPGSKHHLTVLFEDVQAPAAGVAGVLLPSDKEVGVLRFKEGGYVRLHQREVAMNEIERSFVSDRKADMQIRYGGPTPDLVDASLFAAGTDDAGFPYILDVPLAWENVVSN